MIYSTGLRNSLLVSNSFKALMDDCRLKIYDGPTIPATADEAMPGDETLMYEFTVGNDGSTSLTFESSANAGVLLKTASESWQGQAQAAGTMSFWRLSVPPDDGESLSTSAIRVQGTVGTAFADLIVANTTKVLNDPLTIDQFAVAIPLSFGP